MQPWITTENISYSVHHHSEISSLIRQAILMSEASFCLQKAWFICIFQSVLNFGDTDNRFINHWSLIFITILYCLRRDLLSKTEEKQETGIIYSHFILILCSKRHPHTTYKEILFDIMCCQSSATYRAYRIDNYCCDDR